jgi:enoyl-CoA hydratase/carnithine racemase
VDEVVAPGALLDRAQELAGELALIPPPVFRLTKESLRAEALGRINGAGKAYNQAVLELWSAPEALARVREYVRLTLGK